MEFLLRKEEISQNELVNTLERNVAILKIENRYNLRINHELETKLVLFHNVLRNLLDKLDSLWNLAEARHHGGNEIKQFADQISNSWTSISRQISEKYSKIQMASRTLHGVPLSLLLDKVKKEVVLLKLCLQAHDLPCNQEYKLKGYELITEVEELINSLVKCDYKLQQYLSISNIIPHIRKLDSMVDKYVSNVELLSIKKSFLSDLSTFSILVKLLTGELLGYEPIDPNHILIENVPKKPVFIIKNIKRKGTCPYYPT
ncbi:PREDICTED: uncharacterized protein LOC107190078 [Dufourea novaeangliae]|uniref:uncharacterized protein LOC107190078 n=1 Tax=Dufourea novaeangliae TaxID=178035 RepID=UPI000766E180|nr:PREDICTED: uncharacterized protein LOC107190078 [Dufourea novaeangliae]